MHNDLLRGLPDEELDQLRPHIEELTLVAFDVLANAGERLRHVFFPGPSIISMMRPVDGTLVEAGMVGHEGLAGISLLLDGGWIPATMLVQASGACLRVGFDAAQSALERMPILRQRLGRAALAYVDQLMQTLACNSRHSVEMRCARWLLMTHDRTEGDVLHLTHDTLAQMLGVRRAGVTVAAGHLQRAGAIDYHRGQITIVDRCKLEAAACECYAVNRAHADLLTGDFSSPTVHA